VGGITAHKQKLAAGGRKLVASKIEFEFNRGKYK